ncbi:MAG: MoaD/ThiS family protein [Alphaproteobacteria bacterium]
MAIVSFTPNLRRHLDCPDLVVAGATLRAVLDAAFQANPRLRGYVVDEQGRLRRHVIVFIGEARVVDRERLADPVPADARVYVMQALSGG